jgi:hypothetical protein
MACAALVVGAPFPLARAAELYGVELPERLERAERTLVRNGMGTRTATVFRVPIYVAGLYVEAPDADGDAVPITRPASDRGALAPARDATPPAGDAAAILASTGLKAIVMQYLYTISDADMRKGWDYYFAENCPARDCSPYRTQIDAFMSHVSAVEPGRRYEYLFFPDRVAIMRDGEALGAIDGVGFPRLLLSTWIGDVPPTEELKRDLIGRKAR